MLPLPLEGSAPGVAVLRAWSGSVRMSCRGTLRREDVASEWPLDVAARPSWCWSSRPSWSPAGSIGHRCDLLTSRRRAGCGDGFEIGEVARGRRALARECRLPCVRIALEYRVHVASV